MSLTVRGRNREAEALARRYLAELRSATEPFAPTTDVRWFQPYALGFISGHVAFAMQLAASRHALKWFHRWPDAEAHVAPLINELAPQCLAFDADAFAGIYAEASAAWKGGDPTAPINMGAGMGGTAVIMLERSRAGISQDYFGIHIMQLERDLRKLRAPTQLGRLTGYRAPAFVYRYLVMRTLGEEVFGLTSDDADQVAIAAD